RLGAGVGRLLPLPGRPADRARRGRLDRHPAGRREARRRGDRRGRAGRRGDGHDGPPALLALSFAAEVAVEPAAARRLAVARQGYAARARRATTAEVEAAIRRLGIVQVDTVTAVDRAHRLTLAARVGRLPDEALNRLRREGRIFEYWAHEASLLPVDDYPYFRRMMVSAEHHRWFRGVLEEHGDIARQVLDDVEHIGPRSPRDYG